MVSTLVNGWLAALLGGVPYEQIEPLFRTGDLVVYGRERVALVSATPSGVWAWVVDETTSVVRCERLERELLRARARRVIVRRVATPLRRADLDAGARWVQVHARSVSREHVALLRAAERRRCVVASIARRCDEAARRELDRHFGGAARAREYVAEALASPIFFVALLLHCAGVAALDGAATRYCAADAREGGALERLVYAPERARHRFSHDIFVDYIQ